MGEITYLFCDVRMWTEFPKPNLFHTGHIITEKCFRYIIRTHHGNLCLLSVCWCMVGVCGKSIHTEPEESMMMGAMMMMVHTFFTIIYYVCNSNPSCKHVIIIFILLHTPSSSCRRLTASVHSSAGRECAGSARQCISRPISRLGHNFIHNIISPLCSLSLMPLSRCVCSAQRVIIILLAGPLCFQMQIAHTAHQNYMLSKQTWAEIILRSFIYIGGEILYIGAGQVDGNVSRGDDTNLLRLMRNLCMLRWLALSREETLTN